MSAPRMKDIYENQVRKQLIEKFGYKNAMQVPRIDKIVINMGVGEAAQDSKKVQSAATELAAIRSEEHTSELQSLMRISYAVFCLKTNKNPTHTCTERRPTSAR